MGSNQFQKEYIEYLQEQNTQLLTRLNHVKEKYDKKILSKEINQHYLTSAVEDMLNICTALPQEMDLFYDKITAALSAFQDILIRKSEMVLLAEKITKALNLSGKFEADLVELASPGLINQQISGSRANKKVGTVKVSPMINGHVISTEPKIYLSRVPGEFTLNRRTGNRQLSPIIETSPDALNDTSSLRSNIFKEIERINLKNKLSEESPKARFKGPKTWRKTISSFRRHSESPGKRFSFEENELAQVPENDPLEGPSWLYEEKSGMKSSLDSFMDYRRRKRRFASMFHGPEDYLSYTEDRAKKISKEKDEKFYGDNEITDDDKDSGSSEDLTCPSLTSADKNSSFKKTVSKRKLVKKTNGMDSTESKKDSREEISTFLNSRNNSRKSSYSDSSDEGDCKENSFRRLGEVREPCGKLSLKSSVEGMSMKLSFEGTPSKSRCDELASGTNTSTADGKMESASGKITKEMLAKLEDCLSVEESHFKNSSTNASNEKNKLKRSKTKNKSNSPSVSLAEKEGRKRRKAAPSFKLVEPKLNVYVSKED